MSILAFIIGLIAVSLGGTCLVGRKPSALEGAVAWTIVTAILFIYIH